MCILSKRNPRNLNLNTFTQYPGEKPEAQVDLFIQGSAAKWHVFPPMTKCSLTPEW